MGLDFDYRYKENVTLRLRKIVPALTFAMQDELEQSAEYWLAELQKRLPPTGPRFPNYRTNGRQSDGALARSFSIGTVTSIEGEHYISLNFPDDAQHQMEMDVHEFGRTITKEDGFMVFDIETDIIRTHEVTIKPKYFLLGSRTATVNHFYAQMRKRIREAIM